jgi:hypothetical protein
MVRRCAARTNQESLGFSRAECQILWNATWTAWWQRAARWELTFAILLLVFVVLNNLFALAAQIAS